MRPFFQHYYQMIVDNQNLYRHLQKIRRFRRAGEQGGIPEFRHRIVRHPVVLPAIGVLPPVGCLLETSFPRFCSYPPSVLVDVCMIPERTDGSYCQVWSRSSISSSCACFFSLQQSIQQRLWTSAKPAGQKIRSCPETRYNAIADKPIPEKSRLEDPETVRVKFVAKLYKF